MEISLTRAGEKALTEETANWGRLASVSAAR
jgi:hypothetical protein